MAVEHIYPLVFNFKKDKPPQPLRKRILMDNLNNLNENNKIKDNHKNMKRRKLADYSEEDELINDEEIIDEEMDNDF